MINAKIFKLNPKEVPKSVSSTFIGVSFIGILLANAFSFFMTANGYYVTKLIPSIEFIPEWGLASLFALLMQIAILSFWFLLPFVYLKRSFVFFSCVPLILVFMFISFSFSIFSLTYNSKGDAFIDQKRNETIALYESLENIDNHISSSFNAQLDTIEQQADDASQGRDGTYIAECGEICRTFWETHKRLKNDYQSTFNTQAVIPLSDNSSDDPNKLYQKVTSAMTAVEQKIATYRSYARREGVAINNYEDQLQAIREQTSNFSSANLQNGSLQKAELVLGSAVKSIFTIFNSDTLLNSEYIVLVVAILPDILSLFFSLMTKVCYSMRLDNIELMKERDALQDHESILDDVVNLESKIGHKNFRRKARQRSQDRMTKSLST